MAAANGLSTADSGAKSPSSTSDTLGRAMPGRRSRWERVQVNARVRVEIEHVLQRFVRDHDTTVQNCVDLALEEFLAARGYPLTEHTGGRFMTAGGQGPS